MRNKQQSYRKTRVFCDRLKQIEFVFTLHNTNIRPQFWNTYLHFLFITFLLFPHLRSSLCLSLYADIFVRKCCPHIYYFSDLLKLLSSLTMKNLKNRRRIRLWNHKNTSKFIFIMTSVMHSTHHNFLSIELLMNTKQRLLRWMVFYQWKRPNLSVKAASDSFFMKD